MANIGYKFRIYPDEIQVGIIEQTFGCVRLIYNCELLYRSHTYKHNGKSEKLLVSEYKKIFDFLKDVDSLALANAIINLNNAYDRFFKKQCGYPRMKSKKRSKSSYKTNNVNNSIRLEGGKIKLPKLGFVDINVSRDMISGKIKNVTVSKDKMGNYWASINVEYNIDIEPVEVKSSIGLDYKSDGLYIDSNGCCPSFPKPYRHNEKKLARMQKRLARKKRGSYNYIKLKNKIAALHRKIANQRRDFLHQESTRLVKKYDLIAVEDINLKDISSSKGFKLGKSTYDNGFGMFREMLSYKAYNKGKHFIRVNKFYPSTQTCSICGSRKTGNERLTLGDKIYLCNECGCSIDRDLNAAINIRKEGLRLYKSKS